MSFLKKFAKEGKAGIEKIAPGVNELQETQIAFGNFTEKFERLKAILPNEKDVKDIDIHRIRISAILREFDLPGYDFP